MEVLLIRNYQTIRVLGLQDEISGEYLNTATVTAVIKERSGASVAGGSWPIALEYIADSDGNYFGNFDDAIELKNNRIYVIEIAADAGGGLKAFWRFERMAQYRQP